MVAVALAASLGTILGNQPSKEVTSSTAGETTRSTVVQPAEVAVAEVAPELAGFGDLAAVEFPPVSLSVGGDGGSLTLGDGASVTVPTGALVEDVSLTVTAVGLALEYFDTRLGPARTYVIETDRDVSELAEPVVLEVPLPSEIGAVASLEEGEWVGIEVPSGDTTRIEITHFSKHLVTYVPAGIEWLAETGWVAKQQAGLLTGVHFLPETAKLLAEQEHQGWVSNEADQSTRDFYGLDEEGDYVFPTHTQEEMCAELGAVVAGYSDFSLPDDYSKYRLTRYLFNAEAPSLEKYWPEFDTMTKESMSVINEKVLSSTTPLTPGQVLQIAIDANGGNVPMGLLAAHNYLKNLAYLGRSYGDPPPEGKQKVVPTTYGQPASHLESWRQDGAASPAGRLDKLGSLYHIFAAAVVYTWIPKTDEASDESLGDYALAGEALMRSLAWPLASDLPDTEKGAADRCGGRLAATVLTLTSQAAAGAGADGEEAPRGAAAQLESGKTVSIELTPYIPSPDSKKAITSHEVTMEIKPGEYAGYYFTCHWRIELVQTETERGYDSIRYEEGTTWICEGEAYTEDPSVQKLDRINRLPYDCTYTAFDPAGQLMYEQHDSGRGFGGRLDEDLQGDGFFPNGAFPAGLNWDTDPGVLP